METRIWSAQELDSFNALGAESGWAELVRNASLYDSPQWHTVLLSERCLQANFISARDHSRLLAVLPTYRWTGEWSIPTQHQNQHFAAIAKLRSVDESSLYPTLIVGSVGGYVNALSLLGEATPAVSVALLTECEAIARDVGAATIALPGLTRDAALHLREVLGEELVFLAAEPDAYIDIDWPSFDDYLRSLSSNRRRSARREMRAFDQSATQVTITPLASAKEHVAVLVARLQERHHLPGSASTVEEFLSRLVTTLAHRAEAVVAWVQQAPAGACILLTSGDTLYAYKAGFDHSIDPEWSVYFNVGYYLPLRHAVSMSVKRLALGPGTLEAKVLRGARLEPRWFGAWRFPEGARMRRLAMSWNDLHVRHLTRLMNRAGRAWTAADALRFQQLD